MSNPMEEADVQKLIDRERRVAEQRLEADRKLLLQQAAELGTADQLAEKRAELEREAAEVREELARESPAEERARARRAAPGSILLLLLLFLILYLIAYNIGKQDIISFPSSIAAPTPLESQLGNQNSAETRASRVGSLESSATTDDMTGIGDAPIPTYPVDAAFSSYYNTYGGEPIFGRAISPLLTHAGGRRFQWFERARLEEWPENQSVAPDWVVQGGRLGEEFTTGINFPVQSSFIGQPGVRYFNETSHGLRGEFLNFWEANNGMRILGYPISDELNERLEDTNTYTVQYFERGRLEYHPNGAQKVMMGLLGTRLMLNDEQPNIIPPLLQPTPVPVP